MDRPCARAVKVDCPFPLSQVTARNSVVWALTEQRALLYREGVSSFCPEGELWKCDIVRYARRGMSRILSSGSAVKSVSFAQNYTPLDMKILLYTVPSM